MDLQQTRSLVPQDKAVHYFTTRYSTAQYIIVQNTMILLYCDAISRIVTLSNTAHFVQHNSAQCYTTLHYTALHYATLHLTVPHCTTLHYTTLHYTTLHYTTLHYTTLDCTALHYTTLHFITLQRTVILSSYVIFIIHDIIHSSSMLTVMTFLQIEVSSLKSSHKMRLLDVTSMN